MIKGINGSVELNGKFITLHPMNRFDKRGMRTIPVSSLTTVQFKKAGIFSTGYIEFVTAGNNNHQGRASHLKTENTVTFGAKQNAQFEAFRAAVLAAM